MTFVNYKTKNNATSTFTVPVNGSTTTWILKTGEGNLFPSTYPFLLTAEHSDSTSPLIPKPITKREGVKVTNRSGDTLTVVRGFCSVVQDDTANPKTQGTTGLSFDAGDSVSLYVTSEAEDDIKTNLALKVDTSDVVNNTNIYASSSSGTSAYQITLPNVTAYTSGLKILFKADVVSGVTTTLQVNALGTKNIVRIDGTSVLAGDIYAGQIVEVIYDATNARRQLSGVTGGITNNFASNTIDKFYCGESFVAGNFCCIENNMTQAQINVTSSSENKSGGSFSADGHTGDYGLYFTAERDCTLTRVDYHPLMAAGRTVKLKSSGGTTLASGAASGNTYTFSYSLTQGTKYRIEVVSSADSYISGDSSYETMNCFTTPVGGSVNGADGAVGTNIFNITYIGFSYLMPGVEKNVGDVTNNTKLSDSFLGGGVAINKIKVNVLKIGSPTDDLQIRIETDNSGSPSGNLANANSYGSVSLSSVSQYSNQYIDQEISFAGDFTLTAGTVYHKVYSRSGSLNASNYYKIGYSSNVTATRPYKTYNGSARSSASYSRPYTNFEYGTGTSVAGEIQSVLALTNATYSYKVEHIGQFADATGSKGQYKSVYTSGTLPHTGLTPGSTYYLSNTPGAISTSAGSTSRKCGLALTSTKLRLAYPAL